MAFIAAGVLLLGGVTVYAVKTSSQSTVKVVSVSDMSGGGGWSDNSLSGNITSDVSQNIYLADSQTVKKIHVKEGDTVKVGDDLLTYDMTLENLDLEMKKLEKQGIELNIEKANREITKLKNTKPSSDNGNEDPGIGYTGRSGRGTGGSVHRAGRAGRGLSGAYSGGRTVYGRGNGGRTVSFSVCC